MSNASRPLESRLPQEVIRKDSPFTDDEIRRYVVSLIAGKPKNIGLLVENAVASGRAFHLHLVLESVKPEVLAKEENLLWRVTRHRDDCSLDEMCAKIDLLGKHGFNFNAPFRDLTPLDHCARVLADARSSRRLEKVHWWQTVRAALIRNGAKDETRFFSWLKTKLEDDDDTARPADFLSRDEAEQKLKEAKIQGAPLIAEKRHVPSELQLFANLGVTVTEINYRTMWRITF